MDNKLLKYVPKRLKNSIQDIYKDDDGYWAIFKNGHENPDGGNTANGETIQELKEAMKEIS